VSITCTICNTANKDAAIYCKECGTKLANINSSATENDVSRQGSVKSDKLLLIALTIFIVGLIVFGFYNSNNNNVTTETPPVAVEATIGNSINDDPPRGFDDNQPNKEPFYKKPLSGYGAELSLPEIRYCVAEKIKLQAIEVKIDNTSDEQINKYNSMIKDLNNKCGQYQYHENDLSTATNDVESHKVELIEKALKEFFPRKKKVDQKNEIQNQDTTITQEPIQELKEELPLQEPSAFYGQ